MSSENKNKIIKIEDIRKAEKDYLDTVYIFLTLSKLFQEYGISHEIEHDVINCSDRSVEPDFLLFSNGIITEVLEHKSSLNVSYGKKELQDIEEKYKCLKTDGKKYHPEVICLVPISLLKILEDIRNNENMKIFLAGFTVNHDVEKIIFETHDDLSNSRLKEILNEIAPFKHANYSEYRFIKAEPEYEVYTAFTVWMLLITFYDPYIAKDSYFEVNFDNISKRSLEYFPSWIRNNKQLANKRIKRGLEFLRKINFIKWEEGESIIKVYYTRGTKVGDLREYFAKKYVEIYSKRKKKKGRRKLKSGEILSLDKWL